MKFFHLSDLHIGKQLYHYNMLEEQREILKQIVKLAEQEHPQAVLIAGDIYDTPMPSAEAVSVLDAFLTELSEIDEAPAICIIAGNHDSARRIDFASSILAKHQVYIAGMPPTGQEQFLKKVTLWDRYGRVNIYLLPFVRPGYVKSLFPEENLSYDEAVKRLLAREKIEESERNIIVSHQFYTSSGSEPKTSESESHLVGGIENVDAAVLSVFDYAALGHIHRAQCIGREVQRYCGTPLQYSVSEAGDEKTVTMVELGEKGSAPVMTGLALSPVRRVRKLTGTLEEILNVATEENCHDFISITLTDEIEAYRPKEQLEEVYDHILEIKIDNARTRKLLELTEEEIEDLNPYEAFCAFFREMNGRELTEEEGMLLLTVMNEVKEGAE